MTLREYQQQAKLTACPEADLTYCLLGLANEAGEVAGVVKKFRRGDYGEEELREKLRGELGDVLWYVAMVADRIEFDFEDLTLDNMVPNTETQEEFPGGTMSLTENVKTSLKNLAKRRNVTIEVAGSHYFVHAPRSGSKQDLGCVNNGLLTFAVMTLIKSSLRASEKGGYGVQSVLLLVGRICELIKVHPADIAAHNLAKLADRQQRGVIRGSGDER